MVEFDVFKGICYCNIGSIDDELLYLKCQLCEKCFYFGKVVCCVKVF